MTEEHFISIYLDKRRAKANGTYPVRLRVFIPNPRKQKLYPTAFSFTEKEFENIWVSKKTKKEYKEIRLQMQSIENKANGVANKIVPFTIMQFEKKLFRKKGEGVKVGYHYKEKMKEYLKQDRIATADSYKCSQSALKKFVKLDKKNFDDLTLLDINKEWLSDFEYYMIDLGRSITTVGIYLRPLRAIFNKAIDEGELEKEFYPFGKRKYQIPTSKKVKKALTKAQMNVLFNAEPSNKEQAKAKDFWFLSYNCNGMNMKDIAQLKHKDIHTDKIVFYRAKTLFTSKTNLKPITIYLNGYIRKTIDTYGTKNKNPEQPVFSILDGNENAELQQKKVKNFTKLVNKHLKKLCEANELPSEISTYWARHSFATLSVQKGASLEFMQESLGHKDIATTQSYFAGFDNDTKKEFAAGLMDFG